MKKIIGFLVCLFIALSINAENIYTIETIPNPQTANKDAYVSNPDRILSVETENYLNSKLDSLQKGTTAEVAVVAVKSIGENDIKEFAVNLFAYWKIGKKEKNNGLLILFVLDQRQVTFETGYGIEGILPDAICKRIQMQEMVPYFKTNDFNNGMIAGINKISLVLTDPNAAAEIRAESTNNESGLPSFKNILMTYLYISIAFFFIMIFISSSTNKRLKSFDNYTKYKESTSFYNFLKIGSIFLPISLLVFFLIWKGLRSKMRTFPLDCPKCGKKMRRLTEKEEDPYLTSKEIAEENVHSIDYDVWVCDSCQHRKILSYDASFTKYGYCPSCKAKTCSQTDNRIVSQATSFSSGVGEKIYTCKNCNAQFSEKYEIPRIIIASGGGRGGSSGFGGGSFGGGSSGGGGSTSGF